MAITLDELLNLSPTTISRDLSSKYILIAAPYKFGKTTFMCHIPDALILSFEPGLHARAGAYAKQIDTWAKLKEVVGLLKRPELQERYKCVCFDTIELAATLCQEFVCTRANVKQMGDVPYGKLYKEYELEFSKTIRTITMLGYGCVFACHTEVKEIDMGNDKVVERLQPKLDRRAFDIINGIVDIIGVGVMQFDENGKQVRKLITSETPNVKAGNRFTYFPPIIDFSYEGVVNSLVEAIEEEEKHGATIVNNRDIDTIDDKRSFAEVRTEAEQLWKELVEKDQNNAAKIMSIAEEIFGHPIKLSEITPPQQDLFELVVAGMREL